MAKQKDSKSLKTVLNGKGGRGKQKKHPNKHELIKKYRGQGR